MRVQVLLALLAAPLLADEPEPAARALKEVAADGAAHLVSCKGATYWIALPPGHDAKQPTRVLLWLHGSNMNGKAYVDSLKSLEYGKNEILVGVNGNGKVRDWVYNFDYDPKPVLKTLEDLESRMKLGPVYVGGHSQGAYFTMLLLTKLPERFAGGCAFAGGLLKGCDPKAAANRKGKPGPAFALIHGEADPVVDVELSDFAFQIFLDAEWPRLRYYHPKQLNHMFLLGPVKEAIDWLYATTSEDPAELLAAAERFLGEGRGSDALFCVEAARDRKAARAATDALRERILAAGAEQATPWAEVLGSKREPGPGWQAELYDFVERWARVPSAQPALRALEIRRKREIAEASKLSRDAWAAVRKRAMDKARATFGELARDCPTAFEYARAADRWLARNP
ncbi:MAG: hypothetical protein ACT4PV_11345 [Planctomycetaceae bacterium]